MDGGASPKIRRRYDEHPRRRRKNVFQAVGRKSKGPGEGNPKRRGNKIQLAGRKSKGQFASEVPIFQWLKSHVRHQRIPPGLRPVPHSAGTGRSRSATAGTIACHSDNRKVLSHAFLSRGLYRRLRPAWRALQRGASPSWPETRICPSGRGSAARGRCRARTCRHVPARRRSRYRCASTPRIAGR